MCFMHEHYPQFNISLATRLAIIIYIYTFHGKTIILPPCKGSSEFPLPCDKSKCNRDDKGATAN